MPWYELSRPITELFFMPFHQRYRQLLISTLPCTFLDFSTFP